MIKIDLSAGKLESTSARTKFWYRVTGVTLIVSALLGIVWSLMNDEFELTLNVINLFVLPFVFIFPATGWYYRYFSHYVELNNEAVIYKPIGNSKEVFRREELQEINFSNKHLYVVKKDGSTEDYHLDSPQMDYQSVQDIKAQIRNYNQNLAKP